MADSGLTDLQLSKMTELVEKKMTGSLTTKQSEELNKLIQKRDNPELPEGAKTYCQEWITEQLYSRRKQFTSKYTDKGLSVEDQAIELLSNYYGWGMVMKNEKFLENEHIMGTPDLILYDLIPDIKNSWDCFTFPLFENKEDKSYWWQMQGYMRLTGKQKAAIIYCLLDAPEGIIEAEARKLSYRAGYDELEMEFYNKVKGTMTYSHLPIELRVKRFDIQRDDKAIALIEKRVEQCRKFISTLKIPTLYKQLKAA